MRPFVLFLLVTFGCGIDSDPEEAFHFYEKVVWGDREINAKGVCETPVTLIIKSGQDLNIKVYQEEEVFFLPVNNFVLIFHGAGECCISAPFVVSLNPSDYWSVECDGEIENDCFNFDFGPHKVSLCD